MDDISHPTSFGVFKPVGHVVVSFAAATDLDAVCAALAQQAFADDAVQRLTAAQMVEQADGDIARASPMAAVGQELNLVKAQRELALQGHGFLVVRVRNDNEAERVAAVARRFDASRAQHYGHWVIEELIAVGTTERQISESPDRGLDAHTESGHEGAR